MLSICLVVSLLFQEPNHPHTPQVEDGGQLVFTPITAGNLVNIGNFETVIPDGVVYAAEENMGLMVGLLGAASIPNCVGVFYSATGSFEYGVSVQHFVGGSFEMGLSYPASFYNDVFSTIHLITGQDLDVPPEVVIPPEYSEDGASFTLGYAYDNGLVGSLGHGVVIKKVIITSNEALVATVRVHKVEQYGFYEDEIARILDSLHWVSQGVPVSGDPVTLPSLLGITVDIGQPVSLDWQTIAISAFLCVVGISLLAFAIKLSRKNN